MSSNFSLPIIAGAGALALMAMSGPRRRGSGGGSISFPVFSGTSGANEMAKLCQMHGLDENWTRFFLATAAGESRFTSNVVLGNPSKYPRGSKPSPVTKSHGPGEYAASKVAYKRAKDAGRFKGCPWPASAYTFGSGGWWAMIPSNAWAAYAGTELHCRHPWYMLHPVDQVVTGTEYARRIMGWPSFKSNPTWLQMRIGWASPSGMSSQAAYDRMEGRFPQYLQELGIPSGWMYNKVTSLPKFDTVAAWKSLMVRSGMPPGRVGA